MRGFEDLLIDLKSSDPMKRFHAALFLRETGNPKMVDTLINALHEEKDSHVWGGIAYELGRMKASESIGPLIDGLRGKNKSVRYSAAKALARIGEASIGSLVSTIEEAEDPGAKSEAIWALDEICDSRKIELGPLQTQILVDATKSSDDAVRYRAQALLDRIGIPEIE